MPWETPSAGRLPCIHLEFDDPSRPHSLSYSCSDSGLALFSVPFELASGSFFSSDAFSVELERFAPDGER